MANVIQRSFLITRPSPLVFPLTTCSSCISSSVSSSSSSHRISGISQLGSKQQTGGGVLWVPEFSLSLKGRRREPYVKVQAAIAVSEEKKWWEKNAHNMIDIHSTQDFLDALRDAGDKLVIVEFYGTWCGSCRALFPKLCKTAEEHPEIVFLKVNFDENKPMCKRLNVKVLPYFHFYRGAEGQLESFSCSLAKLQKLKDSIILHNTDRCSIGPPLGVGDLDLLGIVDAKDKQAESVSR